MKKYSTVDKAKDINSVTNSNISFVDNRPEAVYQKKLKSIAESSNLVQEQRKLQRTVDNVVQRAGTREEMGLGDNDPHIVDINDFEEEVNLYQNENMPQVNMQNEILAQNEEFQMQGQPQIDMQGLGFQIFGQQEENLHQIQAGGGKKKKKKKKKKVNRKRKHNDDYENEYIMDSDVKKQVDAHEYILQDQEQHGIEFENDNLILNQDINQQQQDNNVEEEKEDVHNFEAEDDLGALTFDLDNLVIDDHLINRNIVPPKKKKVVKTEENSEYEEYSSYEPDRVESDNNDYENDGFYNSDEVFEYEQGDWN